MINFAKQKKKMIYLDMDYIDFDVPNFIRDFVRKGDAKVLSLHLPAGEIQD